MTTPNTLPQSSITPLIAMLRDTWFWLVIASLFTIFAYGHEILGLPPPEVISVYLQDLYHHYGLGVVALGVFVEGFFMVGFYFPGSFILAMAVVLAPKTFMALGGITVVTIAVTLLNSLLNYYLGAKGFYRLLLGLGGHKMIEDIRQKLNRNLKRTLYTAAWHPNFLAIAVIGCGIGNIGLWRVLRHIGLPVTLWLTGWVVLVALLVPIEDVTIHGKPHALVLAFWAFVVFKCAECYYNTQSEKKHGRPKTTTHR